MLEHLPEAIGHALINLRAGLQKTAFWKMDLRAGMAAIELRSPAFTHYGPLPSVYTADGDGMSPPLAWSGVPAEATELVLIVEDADAPRSQPLVHAIAVELAPTDGELAAGALSHDDGHDDALGHDTPQDAAAHLRLGPNSTLRRRWLPPDPPPGHGVHRYVFQLFALGPGEPWGHAPGRDTLVTALAERALASGCLVGTYERHDTSVAESTAPASPPALIAEPTP